MLEAGKHLFGLADTGDAGALMSEQIFGACPTLVFLTDQVFNGDAHIVEKDFIDLVLTVQGDDRPNGDAGCLHIDQQEADATLLLCFGIGAYQAKDPVGIVGQCGPGFLTVNHIVVTLAYCPSL
ncbi:hypothetical protein D9M71_538010 [compost metagenome]